MICRGSKGITIIYDLPKFVKYMSLLGYAKDTEDKAIKIPGTQLYIIQPHPNLN